MNLLSNPGFEGGWWRKTYTGQEYGEIFVPEGWVAFWKEGGPVPHDPSNTSGYGRPEMHIINREAPFLDPLRVRSGHRALKFFTFYRIHDAGVFQKVSGLRPGARVQATGWAHAWSSTHDNPRSSDGAGTAPYFVRVSDLPRNPSVPETGVRNMAFSIGIDPQGGEDPWSGAIVWGEGAHIYNAFAQIPPVEVTAGANNVTVFVRSTVLWPFKHCDAYVDDLRLTPVADPPQTIGIETTPADITAGTPFQIRVTGSATPERLQITFSDDSIFCKPVQVSGGQATCRCVAVELGRFELRVISGTEQVGVLAFDVAAPTAPAPTPTQPPPITSGFVPPRVPYERTYLLLHPGAGDGWLEAVAASGIWDRYRWTVGGSADDAGVGPTVRRVVAVNPHTWPSDLRAFFETYYPGLAYHSLIVATPEELLQKLRSFL
ncbi:MAG: hypothetical protein JXC32_05905 [Anaerolineae bacterium]|nr:hypothetical protein [Anaerolineae bacterium]